MLTDQEKSTLRNRYKDWGLEAVKDDLRRPFRWVYGSPDRNAFASEWVQETEERERRQKIRRGRIRTFRVILLIAVIGLAIGFSGPA